MANSFTKQNIAGGTPGTAAIFNHAETQADVIEADLAAGNLAVDATQLTGTINSARLPNRVATVFLSAGGGTPTTTAGCAAPAKLELPTNDIMLVSLDYDASAQEYATWGFVLPDGYTGGTIVPRFYWTAASGSGGVCWGISGRSLADDEAMDQALSASPIEAIDTLLSANDVHIIAGSALTLNGTPAGGEWCFIKVYRRPAHASDTLAVDAKLMGVALEIPVAYSD